MAKNNITKYLLIGGAVYAAFYFFRNSKQIKGIAGKDDSFKFMMLDRLAGDADYFLGYGNRDENNLWGRTVKDHIKEMKEIYKSLSKKPEWLTYEDILSYEKKMLSK
jgi:hypothetical protein